MRKKRLPSSVSKNFTLEPLALREDEIRRLVLLTTTRYKIDPFVKQLIRVIDKLKAGQTNNITELARPGRDESRAILFAAIAKAVKEGQEMAAYHTAFRPGLYAYENSLDHLLAFMDFLERLRQTQASVTPHAS